MKKQLEIVLPIFNKKCPKCMTEETCPLQLYLDSKNSKIFSQYGKTLFPQTNSIKNCIGVINKMYSICDKCKANAIAQNQNTR